MKGQSAIEYLMTYGWMLLVVAVVGGLIITYVSDQDLEEVSGFEGDQIMVENFGTTGDGNLSLQILHADSGVAEISNVTVRQDDRVAFKDHEEGFDEAEEDKLELQAQESAQVKVPEFYRNETAQSYQVEILYDKGGLENLISQGRITGGLRME